MYTFLNLPLSLSLNNKMHVFRRGASDSKICTSFFEHPSLAMPQEYSSKVKSGRRFTPGSYIDGYV